MGLGVAPRLALVLAAVACRALSQEMQACRTCPHQVLEQSVLVQQVSNARERALSLSELLGGNDMY